MDKIEELIFPFFNGEFDDSDLWKNLRGDYKKIPKNKGIYVIVDNSEIDPVKKIAYIGQAGGKKSNKKKRRQHASSKIGVRKHSDTSP